jgi:hypothetical protein
MSIDTARGAAAWSLINYLTGFTDVVIGVADGEHNMHARLSVGEAERLIEDIRAAINEVRDAPVRYSLDEDWPLPTR